MRNDQQDTLDLTVTYGHRQGWWLRLIVIAALALLLISCDGSNPADPADDGNPPAPETPLTPGSPLTPDTTTTPDTTSTPPDTTTTPGNALDSTLTAERARIALRYTESDPELHTLQVLWLQIDLGGLLGPLLECQPLPYAGDAQIIGPAGGVFRIGNHVVTIPAGAVRDSVVISAESDPALAVGVKFLPEGLQFEKPIELDLDYNHCNGLLSLLRLQPFRGAYVSDDGSILEYPASADDRAQRRVRVQIDHFSKYAVAY